MKQTYIYGIPVFCFVFFWACNTGHKKNAPQETEKDSISLWIKMAKNESLTPVKRKQALKKSYLAIMAAKNGTAALKDLGMVAYRYLDLKDTVTFKSINNKVLRLAKKEKDSSSMADGHWNYAIHYNNHNKYDSAYYHYKKAYGYFEKLGERYYAAEMLYGMAHIRFHYGDNSGSEEMIVKAISSYRLLGENESLYASYNQLALIQGEIGEYDRALFYHNKALGYLEKMEDKTEYETSLNNIGVIYQDMGDHTRAVEYFDRALENKDLKNTDIDHYARLLDNRAYSKHKLMEDSGLEEIFLSSLRIRDSIENLDGVATVKLHLAEYYGKKKQYAKALLFANKASLLAHRIKSNLLYLESLGILSRLDTLNSNRHLAAYIKFNDSLRNIERRTQNRFARISFETDEYIEEAKRLSKQRKRILVIGFVTVLIVSLAYYVIIQRSRNKRLLLETEQRKANEQVYLLTIEQQKRLEEEKTEERNRISQELHDGILGKLFGVRLNMGFLEINGSSDTLERHKVFLGELQGIEKELREVSHKLNANFSDADIDFGTIIEQLLIKKSRLVGFTYRLGAKNIVWDQIDEIIKVNLYRVLQEALQNIVKYANAKNVTLHFSIKDNTLMIRIADNGIGFNVKKLKKGIGIKNMRSRIRLLKGTMGILSKKNIGTTIDITVPL